MSEDGDLFDWPETTKRTNSPRPSKSIVQVDISGGARAVLNGDIAKIDLTRAIIGLFPDAVIVTACKAGTKIHDAFPSATFETGNLWERLPLRKGDRPLVGIEVNLGEGRRIDIFLADPVVAPWGFWIEVKFQDVKPSGASNGTAYDKLCRAVFCTHETIEGFHNLKGFVVCTGKGFERGPGADRVAECHRHIARYQLKPLLYRTPREFIAKLNDAIRRAKNPDIGSGVDW